MASFKNQHVINSMQDDQVQVDDGFFDLKPLVSEVFPAFPYCNSNNSIPIPIPQNSINGQVNQLNITNLSSLYPAAEFNQRGWAASSSPLFISFGETSPSYTVDLERVYEYDDVDYNRKIPIRRNPIQAQYHVEAERKRRENLTDLFIALSKVVPGLKKLDKASILGNAIEKIEELQERMKILEEDLKKNSTTSDATTERYLTSTDDHYNSSLKDNLRCTSKEQIPDIKVKILDKNVLIKILCENRYKGCISSMSSKLEKLYLKIVDTRLLQFGCSALDVSINAQMGSEFSSTAKDIIQHLQISVFQLTSPHMTT